MTVRNLEHVLRPRSVVVIGASDEPGSVGHTLAQNMLSGGFRGPIYLVNPHHAAIDGQLAVVATPPDGVPPIIEALGKKGTRAAVVITAGFSPALKQGHARCGAARPGRHVVAQGAAQAPYSPAGRRIDQRGARCSVRSWSGTLVRSFCRSFTTRSATGLASFSFSSVSTPGGATSIN
jgi:hypothetical protein